MFARGTDTHGPFPIIRGYSPPGADFDAWILTPMDGVEHERLNVSQRCAAFAESRLAGAVAIVWQLVRKASGAPSTSTIRRILHHAVVDRIIPEARRAMGSCPREVESPRVGGPESCRSRSACPCRAGRPAAWGQRRRQKNKTYRDRDNW